MFGFGFKKNRFLGIDIGTSSIKVVELEARNGRPYLSNYAWVSVPETDGNASGEAFQTSMSAFLKKIIKKAHFSRGSAYMSIPSFSGLVTLIDFPDMSGKELEQAIKFEVHKYIPTSLDEVSISWEAVGKRDVSRDSSSPDPSGKKIQILLVAASKNKVAEYEKIAKAADLNLKGVEIESISMVESLVGKDRGNFIIVDIGSHICNIIYVEKGVVKANRNFDAGGEDITLTIAKSLEVSRGKAETEKMSKQNFFNPRWGLRFPSLEIILAEIDRILGVFSAGDSSRIDALILSGGTANFTGLKEYFQEKTGIQAIEGNPFGRVGYDKRMEGTLMAIKGRFSVSVGLALKGFSDNSLSKKKK